MSKSDYIKLIAGVVVVALIASVGYLTYIYTKDKSEVVTQITETPIPETPSPSPTQTPLPVPEPTTRMGYVRQQLLASGFDSNQVEQILTDQRLNLYPVKQVAYKAPNWSLIKQKLYAPSFVQKGKDYIKANQAVFDKAEQDYGVPKEVLAGIIAIETEFGASSGTTPTFNALYSRMEQWPATKWKAQASQLIALATYCIEAQKDCFSIKGSYAGALGIVQFMPYSLLTYAVDGNKDGTIDLYNPVDAIPSAANFLIQHGWNESPAKALTGYYGSSEGYPEIVLAYASLLKN